MGDSADILAQLQAFCRENGILKSEQAIRPNADLVDSGALDSMGLATLQAWIEESWNVSIQPEVFLMELRTLEAISQRLEQEGAR